MKKYTKITRITFFFILFLLTFLHKECSAQVELEWAGSSANHGMSLALDGHGYLYSTGMFSGVSDLNPTSDTFYVTAVGGNDIYIQKVDLDGNFIWSKAIGGTGDDQGLSIAADNNGNTYITGYFSGTADFDPGLGVSNLTAQGQKDIFVLKLGTQGQYLWVKHIKGAGNEVANSIEVDALGNIYLAGYYNDTVDFDPGVGVSTLTFQSGFGNPSNTFILKLDAQGNFLWVKNINSTIPPAMTIDGFANIYITGTFLFTVDFDLGPGTYNLTTSSTKKDVYILKLDSQGNFVWARDLDGLGSGNDYIESYDIAVDDVGNVYTTGTVTGVADFDPGTGVDYGTSGAPLQGDVGHVFVSKLDVLGNFVWARRFGGTNTGYETKGLGIAVDKFQNVYTTGWFKSNIDFDPDFFVSNIVYGLPWTAFFHKLDAQGDFQWGFSTSSGGLVGDLTYDIIVDNAQNVYGTGKFLFSGDFDPGPGVTSLAPTGAYLVKYKQKGVVGRIYHDFNQSCTQDLNDLGLINRRVTIMPGNYVAMTNSVGVWAIDSLPVGSYTLTADSSGSWDASCGATQNFIITNPDSLINVAPIGFYSTSPCANPDLSVYSPFLRPGFSNNVYIQVCNQITATGVIDSAYIIIELDSLLTVQSASLPFTSLGNNQYQVDWNPAIYPGRCLNFWLNCHLSTTAVLGQTLCLNAQLFPVDSCALDETPNPFPTTINPCNTAYDFSHLEIRPSCNNDTISFVIQNTGDGDMTCFSQVRLYADGVLFLVDSVQLVSGATRIFEFLGDGRTWRLEVDQHPLHYGNSQPSSTIELCGNAANWTSNLVNILPQNDADPVIDIYCGLVTGSYDPNDKTGYPLGVGAAHDILPNQDLEYVINFQNTGTDTAFTVVIRDTLSTDFDIFSVRSGVSSADYTFKMYGQRVLEWTFNNIMLPDSNVNEARSHGFVTFKVKQTPDLPNGTILQNTASIYFDFNAPIITNTSWHSINDGIVLLTAEKHLVEEQLQIKIYPNPTTGILQLDMQDNKEINIIVLDNLGRVLLTKQSNDLITDLDLSSFSSGIYYVVLNNGKEVATQKVVKQ